MNIVTSSPKANSFYNGGRVKKYIPWMYRYYESLLLKMFRNKENFGLYEFEKQGWTFHSKGIWIYENNKILPNMTIIGSSNYSINRFSKIRS